MLISYAYRYIEEAALTESPKGSIFSLSTNNFLSLEFLTEGTVRMNEICIFL